MARIRVLPPHIANQIAAGEVVERPASVVKELVENALDAGATSITVEIENGGIDLIRVTDDGKGISEDECRTAFLRHATSKISTSEELSRIVTLGFRGEALASIAAIANVCMRTRTADAEHGTLLSVSYGEFRQQEPCACLLGTSLEVRDLFANVPARLKFLKSVRTEAGYIGDYVSRMMMAVPSVAFRFINSGKTVYQTFGDGKLKNALLCVYGSEIIPHLRTVDYDDGYIAIGGYIGTESISRPNRLQQSFFMNGRYIHSYALSAALQRAFDTRLMVGRFPFAVLSMRISGSEVDVNVHPTKMEVRFVDEQRVIRAVTAAAHRALLNSEPNHAFPTVTHTETTERSVLQIPNLRASHTATTALPIRERSYADRSYTISAQTQAERTALQETSIRPFAPMDEKREKRHEWQNLSLLTEQPYKVLGAAFNTFWIIQQGDDLFMIDQHAAHERRLFEIMMRHQAETVIQTLLAPVAISLSPVERSTLEENREELEHLGFAFDYREDGVVQLCSVPQVLGEPLMAEYLHDVLEQLESTGKASANELRRERIIQAACKHAVKAGEALTKEEIIELLNAFANEGIPMTCPHGRPVMIRLTKREIEKMFKRIL